MADEGTYTVILARNGAPEEADVRLLRAVEDALRLPREHLVRSAAMARPEFKLAEGIDATTAQHLADAATGEGFAPRVLARTGIERSARRSPLPLLGGMAGLGFMLLFVMRWLGPLLGRVGLVVGVVMAAIAAVALVLAWQRSIRLPLALSTASLLGAPGADRAMSDAADGALTALQGLHEVLTAEVPPSARGSLQDTHDELRQRVDRLRKEARHLPTDTETASTALEQRLATMDPGDPGRAVLQAALDQERAAMDAAAARHSEIIAELLAVRRAASDAARTLATAPETDAEEALERVRAQAAAMRRAAAEVQRR